MTDWTVTQQPLHTVSCNQTPSFSIRLIADAYGTNLSHPKSASSGGGFCFRDSQQRTRFCDEDHYSSHNLPVLYAPQKWKALIIYLSHVQNQVTFGAGFSNGGTTNQCNQTQSGKLVKVSSLVSRIKYTTTFGSLYSW